MRRTKINLGKILLDLNKISMEDLDRAAAIQKKTNRELKDILLSDGFVNEEDLLGVVSLYLSIPFIDPLRFEISPEVVKIIPETLARKHSFFPLYKKGDVLLMAVAEPLDVLSLDDLRITVGCEIKEVLGKGKSILECIDTYYTSDQSLPEILEFDKGVEIVRSRKTPGKKGEDEPLDLVEESEKEPIVRAVDLIINEAITKRASDIHLEPTPDDLTVRFRIDGVLHKVYSLPRKIQRGILARVKILSNLDITKFYLPQDGRFNIKMRKKEIDFRVSSLPTVYGEKFVLRILERGGGMVTLNDLGFSEQPLHLLQEAIKMDHGIILITGPTGSGKSTTLNAILSELNTINKHIVTIEDPVEYHIDGVGQTQIRPEINLTFAASLRGILRQSPDTIMVGEIRDAETADIAIKASLIGQLIFSTLHTNDAISAFTRLIDMGVERYLVASSAILICAQRLCRRVCASCKEPLKSVPEYVLEDLAESAKKDTQFFQGTGCNQCYDTGYKGRVAIIEALKVDDYIRDMIIREVSLEEIKNTAIKEGRLIPLRTDGLVKAASGITTVEEVYRVTAKD